MKKEKQRNNDGKEKNKFAVIFNGQLKEGLKEDDVKKNIAHLYGKSLNDMDRLFWGWRMTVKKNASLDVCRKIRRRFEQAGALCRIYATHEIRRWFWNIGQAL